MVKFSAFLLLILASAFYVSLAAMLRNGDFEYGPNPAHLSGTKVEGKYAIPGWEARGFVEYIKAGTKQGDMVLVVPQGNYAVRLGSDASISQKVKAQKGKFYALTFSFSRTCSQDEVLNVTISPNSEKDDSGILPLQTVYSSVGWDSYAWGFLAEADVVEIILHKPRDLTGDVTCGPIIDTIALNILDRPRLPHGNLVKNGGFGEGPYVFHDSSTGVLIPPNVEDDHSPLPAWMIQSLKAVKYIDSLHFFIPEGERAVELLAGQESCIAQTIRTQPDKFYALTFLVGDARNGCVGPLAIEAFAGKAATKVTYQSKGIGGFTKARLLFRAESARTTIRFLSTLYTMTVDGSMCGPVLDDVKVVNIL